MKTRLIAIYLISISCLYSFSQSNMTVIFQLQAPGLSAAKTVYITGSIGQLGFWRPDSVKMEYKGQDNWTCAITIKDTSVIEYKYTLGSWSTEGADSKGLPLSNFRVKVSHDTVVKDTISHWTDPARNQKESTITGTIKSHRNFKADVLLPRDVLVWLPPGYEAENDRRYPVLYMQDGQNVFDAATSSFGNEWHVDESCDSLIHAAKIPPLIVVAINNSSERGQEYKPGKKGSAYMDFVVNKLKPFIDSTYRTKTSAKNTFVGGSSSGGTIAFMLAWEYPDIFSKAICMSPALKIQDIDYVKVVKESTKKRNVFFYLYNGAVDLEKLLQPGVEEMISVLKEKGYREDKDFKVLIDLKAVHNEKAWARHFPQALETCFSSTAH